MPPPGEKFINADMRFVGGDYFRAMEIPLVDGRRFTEDDRRPGPLVTLVDTRMAAQLWPGQIRRRKRLRMGFGDDPRALDHRRGHRRSDEAYTLDADSRMAMYFAHAQFPARAMNVVVRSTLEPATLTSAVDVCCARSTRTCRCTGCAPWRHASTSPWRGAGSRRCCSRSSRASRWVWPRSGPTA